MMDGDYESMCPNMYFSRLVAENQKKMFGQNFIMTFQARLSVLK